MFCNRYAEYQEELINCESSTTVEGIIYLIYLLDFYPAPLDNVYSGRLSWIKTQQYDNIESSKTQF